MTDVYFKNDAENIGCDIKNISLFDEEYSNIDFETSKLNTVSATRISINTLPLLIQI